MGVFTEIVLPPQSPQKTPARQTDPVPGRLPTVPAVPTLQADAAADLPDAAVTVTDAGTVIARFPGDVVFYVTATAR